MICCKIESDSPLIIFLQKDVLNIEEIKGFSVLFDMV